MMLTLSSTHRIRTGIACHGHLPNTMTSRAAIIAAHYARLGLRQPCTREQIVAAYREAAFREHPDHGGNAAKFAQLNSSYQAALQHCRVYDPASLRSHGVAGQGRAGKSSETNRFLMSVFLPVTTLAAVSIKLVYSSTESAELRAGGTSRFLPDSAQELRMHPSNS